MTVQLPGLSDPRGDAEVLRIFREIDRSPAITQRELASRLGISLGKVNLLINSLIGKGLVKVENVRKSNSASAFLYYLTPSGIEVRNRTTCRFLQRRIEEYEHLGLEIELLREEVRRSGFSDEQDRNGNGETR